MSELTIKDLHVSIEGKPIIKGLNLSIRQGEVHAIMGPNGTGKSTLAYTIMGHPNYEVTGGDILIDGESILEMAPDERSRAGVFLAFQYPVLHSRRYGGEFPANGDQRPSPACRPTKRRYFRAGVP